MSRYLAIIGTAKPELTGATKITDNFEAYARSHNLKILNFKFKTYLRPNKHKNLNTFFIESKLVKFLSFIGIIIKLPFYLNSIKTAYIQENGGIGKYYDIYLLILLILFKKNCYYHNHSSNKYVKYDFLTKIIQLLTKFNITNIFLSEIEYKKFIRKYGNLKNYYIISNSAFIKKSSFKKKQTIITRNNIRFGLLSNLYKDKGLNEFIDLARYGAKNKKTWEFYLAGPIVYDSIFYKKILNKLDNLTYYGPINDEDQKIEFYQSLDFFVFLTTFINESEPLVVLESISNGCIPIVYDRGSISDLICDKKLIIERASNPSPIINKLIEEISIKNEFKSLSSKSFDHYCDLRKNSISKLEKLMQEIIYLNNS